MYSKFVEFVVLNLISEDERLEGAASLLKYKIFYACASVTRDIVSSVGESDLMS